MARCGLSSVTQLIMDQGVSVMREGTLNLSFYARHFLIWLSIIFWGECNSSKFLCELVLGMWGGYDNWFEAFSIFFSNWQDIPKRYLRLFVIVITVWANLKFSTCAVLACKEVLWIWLGENTGLDFLLFFHPIHSIIPSKFWWAEDKTRVIWQPGNCRNRICHFREWKTSIGKNLRAN